MVQASVLCWVLVPFLARAQKLIIEVIQAHAKLRASTMAEVDSWVLTVIQGCATMASNMLTFFTDFILPYVDHKARNAVCKKYEGAFLFNIVIFL